MNMKDAYISLSNDLELSSNCICDVLEVMISSFFFYLFTSMNNDNNRKPEEMSIWQTVLEHNDYHDK